MLDRFIMASLGELVIFGEASSGSLHRSVYELLGRGTELKQDLSCTLSVVILGHGLDEAAREAVAHGAERVYLIPHEGLAHYSLDRYLGILQRFCATIRPRWFLFPHTPLAQDLTPRLAMQLGTGLALGCLAVRVDPRADRLVYGRPVYGGKAVAEFTLKGGSPEVATVLPRTYARASRDFGRRGEIILLASIASYVPDSRTRILSWRGESESLGLEEAEVVVAGGAGLGGVDGFRALEKLARVLGGAVGASKKAIDLGWISPGHQIGISGAIVAPRLYIAVAISGASQHMVGCNKAQKIVAINRDPEAPIFQNADYGVVGDWKGIVPSFLSRCQELLGAGEAGNSAGG